MLPFAVAVADLPGARRRVKSDADQNRDRDQPEGEVDEEGAAVILRLRLRDADTLDASARKPSAFTQPLHLLRYKLTSFRYKASVAGQVTETEIDIRGTGTPPSGGCHCDGAFRRRT